MNKARILAQLVQLLAGKVPSRPDWDGLMYAAGEELIVTQLMSRLEPVRAALPMEVRTYLSETRKRSAARNERLRETFSHTLAALNAAGIEPVLLKGAALWATEAGPQDRLIRDIDI